MSEDMVKAVCDPFTTTRKTRKVGLGLPLLKMTAQATGGENVHRIQTGRRDDRARDVRTFTSTGRPWGDGRRAVYAGADEPTTDFRFTLDYDGKTFALDTREVREAVAPIPLNHPEISAWIRDCLKQNIDELHGGVFS